MKLTTSILALLGLAATALACTASQGCCWNDKAACRNQHKSCKGISAGLGDCPCDEDAYVADFCSGFNCNGADCCDTTTKLGRSCP